MAAIDWTQLQQACAIALTRQLGSAISTYDPLFIAMFPLATSYAEDRINQEIPFLGNRNTVTGATNVIDYEKDDLGNYILDDQGDRIRVLGVGGTPYIAWAAFTALDGAKLSVPEQLYIVNGGANVPYDRVSDDFIRRVWPVPTMTVAPSLTYQGGRYWATPDASNLLIAPTPDGSYDVTVTGLYYPVPISAANPTTYLSTYYPDLLTAGCLVYLSGALTRNFGAQADEPKLAMSWEQVFQSLLAPARDEERRRRGLKPDVPMPPPPPMPPGPG